MLFTRCNSYHISRNNLIFSQTKRKCFSFHNYSVGLRPRVSKRVYGLWISDVGKCPNIFIHETWQEGKVLVFDDSFEHEVWNNGTTWRLVLIVDVWHPELTPEERASLTSI